MKKSAYSIMLMDHVVEAIDALAARQGTSRSNLINQILAEHVSFQTPEKRMQSIFSVMEEQMQEIFRVQMQASDAMLSMQSALRYKYRPTLRYSVELLREPTKHQLGWLRISCRTQSRALLDAMDDFFRFWIQLEVHEKPICSQLERMYEIGPGRLTRCLIRNGTQSTEEIGNAISLYIHQFDAMIQDYFTGMQQGVPTELLRSQLVQQFAAMRKKQEILV
ncbi:MAG: hypothetical protein IJ512_07975 [Ruminococcus sp.]|nr:hypothetical protein [Ruminococcus sp.]